MPRSKPSTSRSLSSTTVSSARCQFLIGGVRCHARTLLRRHVCGAHLQAYEKSYRDYKDAAEEAKTFFVQLKRKDVGSLDLIEVDARSIDVRAYIETLEREMELRREHDRIFVGDREYLLAIEIVHLHRVLTTMPDIPRDA